MSNWVRTSAMALIGAVSLAGACPSWPNSLAAAAKPASPPCDETCVAEWPVAAPTFDACLSADDEADADRAGVNDPWRLAAAGGGLRPDPSEFCDGSPGPPSTGLEPNLSTVAPASEIRTGAMAALGVVLLAVRRRRRAQWRASRTAALA
jgi:MYXO-CTERM domain-containing protein